jgi:ribosome-associated protein
MAKKAAAKKSARKPATKAQAAPAKFEGEVMARAAAEYADDKKAEDIIIMDVRGISPVTDYFMICSVTSLPQLRAVRDEIWDRFIENHQLRPLARDESLESLWLILHYGDVMVHIFHREKRSFYALEQLWNDAPRVEWSAAAAPAAPKKQAARKATRKKAAAKGEE